ncbi:MULTISPECIES: ABC transporter [Streptococcus]|nr:MULTISPECIES: ABC transporter [Streptococcus]
MMNEDIIEAINELKKLIDKFNIYGVQIQVSYLDSLEEQLVEGAELTTKQKITVYNQLFPPRGGLSDINYWHDNFEVRKQVNEQLSKLKTKISDYLFYD